MTAAERDKRNDYFQHAVLAGLWVIILWLFGMKNLAWRAGVNFQSGAIGFGDLYGQQHDGAKAYRREITYGGILNM